MEGGAAEERQEHLLAVLTTFLQDRISRLLSDEVEFDGAPSDESGEFLPEESGMVAESGEIVQEAEREPISQNEAERFADVDLKLLDNKAYFKSVFEGTDS